MVEDIPILTCRRSGQQYQNACMLTRDAAPRDRRPRRRLYAGEHRGAPGRVILVPFWR
jgi:hypothetical protein